MPPHAEQVYRSATRRSRFSGLFVAGLVLLAGSSIAIGQDSRRAQERPRDAGAMAEDQQRVQRAAGDLLARTLLRRARNLSRPTTSDYRLAALGLNIARRASPQDAELLRHEIEAWTAADDTPRLIEATRELVRLDPRDTIAQLRLIDTQIGRLNTVEDRRLAYERLLGSAGQNLRPSVRSRLALDAALLAREDGDQRMFLKLLTDATLLDATNKNAAALYASVMLPYADTPLERFELIANMLQADPLDVSAYENAAIELMSSGAYDGAARFLNRMRDLLTASGQDFMSRQHLTEPRLYDEARVNDFLIVSWHTRGSESVLSYIADAQGHAESRFLSEVRAMRERGFSEAQMQQAFGQRTFPMLPYQLEMFRLLALIGQPEEKAREMAFRQRPIRRDEFFADANTFNLEGFIQPPPVTEQMLEDLRDQYPDATEEIIRRMASQQAREARDVNPVHEAATRFMLSTSAARRDLRLAESVDERTKRLVDINIALESIWMLLIAELSIDIAEERFTTLLDQFGEGNLQESAVKRYRGWIACNRGDFEKARELLTPLSENDTSALYALGMTELRSGNTDQAVEHFNRLRLRFPQTVLACVATDRITTITGRAPQAPGYVRELNEYARAFAPWIERLTRSPREFMSLSVRPSSPTIGSLDRTELVLRLTNTSGRPLAVGPNSPINSRFLLTPRVDIEGREYTAIIRDLLRTEARRQMNLSASATLPPEVAQRVDSIIEQQVLIAGRRLLEVVDADRVLRLEPNETIVIPIWAGRGNAGELIDRNLTERVTVQWSVAQGFVQAPRRLADGSSSSGFVTGPMSMSTRTDQQLRIKVAEISPTLLIERLNRGEGAELARTILHATSVLSRPIGAGVTGAEVQARSEAAEIRSALMSRAQSLSDDHLALLFLRLGELGTFNVDDELRRNLASIAHRRLAEQSGLETPQRQFLLAAALVSACRSADDPLIRIAKERGDRVLREFAELLADILRESGFVGADGDEPLDQQREDGEPVFEIDESFLLPQSDG